MEYNSFFSSFISKLYYGALFCLLLANTGCPGQEEEKRSVAPTSSALEITPASYKTSVVSSQSKIPFSNLPPEFVYLSGVKHKVMPPWLGNRVTPVADEDFIPEVVMLPIEYTFEESKIYVTAKTRDAFLEMVKAAREDGVELAVDSGYRSVQYQRRIFEKKLYEGENFYDVARWVAPPGYSEHALGTTLDFVPSDWSFCNTPQEKWLLEHAAEYSFVQTYPQKNKNRFSWEPWHWKYVDENDMKPLPGEQNLPASEKTLALN